MTCARTSRSNKTRAHPPSSRRERAHFDALRTFAMGRGRRGARSSDDEDDGVSPAPRGVQSSQVSGGGRAGKKWQPGMSGSQQKARAKEQRLEQERRKAERERRNEDKRAERDRLHRTEAHRDTPPKSAGKHRRSRVDEGSSSPAVGTPVHAQNQHATHHLDAARVRRELRRLFGRIEHGGGVSLLSGRVVLVDDVVVVLHESSVEERRKSGAGAWSQRLQKGGERDVSLSAFLAMNGARDVAGSPSVYSSSPTSGLGAGFAGSAASAPEPPYHLVARVVARGWPSADDDLDRRDDRDAVEEETLWTNHQGGPSVMAIVDDFGEMRLGGSPGGFGSRSPGDAFPGGVSDGRLRDRDAFSLLPRHCWEDVASLCDPRSLARLAATCAGLAGVVRSTTVRRARTRGCLGNRPPASDFRESRVGASRVVSGAAPPPPLSPAAAEELGARRGWAATCASAIAADAWIPREIDADPAEEDGSEDEGSDGDAEDDAAFDADDADFARERDARPARTLTPVDDEEEEGDRDVTWFARDAAPRAVSEIFGRRAALRDSNARRRRHRGVVRRREDQAVVPRRRRPDGGWQTHRHASKSRGIQAVDLARRGPRRLPCWRRRRSGHRVGRRHARGESVQAPRGGGHTTGTGRRRDARARRARRRAGGGTLVRGRRGERRGHLCRSTLRRRRRTRRRDARRRAPQRRTRGRPRTRRPRRFVRRS